MSAPPCSCSASRCPGASTSRASAATACTQRRAALGQSDAEAVLARLHALAGRLPQNVERSVADWMSQVPPRARLRSAIMVDLGSPELADHAAGLLGSLIVERLAPHLLAVRADDLAGVSAALQRAGIELDTGLDRVSGHWFEPSNTQERYEHWWRPSPSQSERTALPHGRLVSGLGPKRSVPDAGYDLRRQMLDRFQLELDDADFDDDLEPGEVVLESSNPGCPSNWRTRAPAAPPSST